MARINRVKRSLSPTGVLQLRAMIIDNLKSDRDIRQIFEHEIRCSIHFGQKGFKVTFADLEGLGTFDLLVETPSASVEVECKTVSKNTGSQIKSELTVDLSEAFHKSVLIRPPVDESGLFTLTLNKPAADCKNLARQLEDALRSATARSFLAADFSLVFSPRPQWQKLLYSERWVELQRQISLGRIINAAGKIVGLDICPHKPSVLSQRLVSTIKDGADQCTGKTRSVIWLHFVGVAEAELQSLAEFSMEESGAGLNAIVAKAVHPSFSSTDRNSRSYRSIQLGRPRSQASPSPRPQSHNRSGRVLWWPLLRCVQPRLPVFKNCRPLATAKIRSSPAACTRSPCPPNAPRVRPIETFPGQCRSRR